MRGQDAAPKGGDYPGQQQVGRGRAGRGWLGLGDAAVAGPAGRGAAGSVYPLEVFPSAAHSYLAPQHLHTTRTRTQVSIIYARYLARATLATLTRTPRPARVKSPQIRRQELVTDMEDENLVALSTFLPTSRGWHPFL